MLPEDDEQVLRRGRIDIGEGDDIFRISRELQKHIYAFGDSEARELIAKVASSWNFIKGLGEKDLDVFINTQLQAAASQLRH